jgi:hypothetical protein
MNDKFENANDKLKGNTLITIEFLKIELEYYWRVKQNMQNLPISTSSLLRININIRKFTNNRKAWEYL